MGNKQGKNRKNRSEAVALKEAEDDNMLENGNAGRRKLEGIPFDKYVFPFENLVFEGGGNKGLAYCGAVRVSVQFCNHNTEFWMPYTLKQNPLTLKIFGPSFFPFTFMVYA